MEKNLSEKQLQANRKNALKSTGPKSLVGKEKVSLNAFKYGFFSNRIIIPSIDGEGAYEQFHQMYDSLIQDFVPRNTLERVEIANIAYCIWKKLRLQNFEKAHLEKNANISKMNSLLSRIESQPGIEVVGSEEDIENRSLFEELLEKELNYISDISSIPDEELQHRIRKYETRLNKEIDRSLSVIRNARLISENT